MLYPGSNPGCMVGECLIHCTMPLGQEAKVLSSLLVLLTVTRDLDFNLFCQGLLLVIGRERERAHGSGTLDDRSTNYFFLIDKSLVVSVVQTPAACMTGECFFHFAMPLVLRC